MSRPQTRLSRQFQRRAELEDDFAAGLQALARRRRLTAQRIAGLQRLSASATLQTWSFDAIGPGLCHPLILRRSPGGLRGTGSLPLPLEAALISAVARSRADLLARCCPLPARAGAARNRCRHALRPTHRPTHRPTDRPTHHHPPTPKE